MTESIIEFFSELFAYIRHGKVDGITIATSEEDVELARCVQRELINDGFNCRILVGEEVTLDDDSITIHPGKLVIVTLHKGHAFVRPGITATIATVN